MKKSRQYLKGLAVASLLLNSLVSDIHAQEELFYFQEFFNGTGVNQPSSTIGWSAYGSAAGDATERGTPSGTIDAGISPQLGYDDFSGDPSGYYFVWGGNPENVVILSNQTVDASQYELSRIDFYMWDNDANIVWFYNWYIVVQVGGDWYYHTSEFRSIEIDDRGFQDPIRSFAWTRENGWAPLIFDPNNPSTLALSGDPEGPLPSGSVENIGFFSDREQGNGTSHIGIDRLSIYVIPAQVVNDWYGYPIDPNGWVDTGSWMGLVNVAADPWIWVVSLGSYTYITNDSGWVYVPR